MKAIAAAEADQERLMKVGGKSEEWIVAEIYCKHCHKKHLFGGKKTELLSEETRKICPKWKEHKRNPFKLLVIHKETQKNAERIKRGGFIIAKQ